MSERFELSFKNKEVRMWCYLAIPTFIIIILMVNYSDTNYQFVVLLAFWVIFYTWRYFYRKKNKDKTS